MNSSILKKYIFVTLCFSFFYMHLWGQTGNSNRIWYFGDQAGLDFNTTPPTVLNNNAMESIEGTVSVSDNNGDLLFYSDGLTVWNRNHTPMPNGTGLPGHPSTTQTVCFAMPGNAQQYYLFSIDYAEYNANPVGINKGIHYSVIDMTLNGGLGDIVPSTKNTFMYSKTSEKAAYTAHANGTDMWLLTHGWQNNRFYAHQCGPNNTVMAPVITDIGFSYRNTGPTGASDHAGYMRFSPDGTKLAVAVQGRSMLELYDFDKCTGVLSNVASISFGNLNFTTYGVEFSPDGSKLYTTTPREVRQFDMGAGSNTAVLATESIVFSDPSGLRIQGLQRGPDGKIYVARLLGKSLDIIENPNALGVACSYTAAGITIDTGSTFPGKGRNGLPFYNYTDPLTSTTINVDQTGVLNTPADCGLSNGSIEGIVVTGISTTATFNWTDENGNFVDASLDILNLLPGTYTLGIEDGPCNVEQVIITVDEIGCTCTATIEAGPDVTINTGQSTQLEAIPTGGTPASYSWTPATGLDDATTANPTASPTVTTTYTVTADFGGGCTDTDTVTVNVNAPVPSCNDTNLIPNASFENYKSCPKLIKYNSGDELSDYAEDWFQATEGTSDFFNRCNTNFYEGSVPNHVLGNQEPRTGDGYAGFWAYDYLSGSAYREYLSVELDQTLEAGQEYEISFYISLAEESLFPGAVDQLGVWFSDASPNFSTTNYLESLGIVPQLLSPKGTFYEDTDAWMEVNLTYTAMGNETFLTIGNFFRRLDQVQGANGFSFTNSTDGYPKLKAYYFVDDISLKKTSVVSIDAGADVTINMGDSASLAATPTGGTPVSYAWTPTTGLDDANIANPTANPTVTTTYTVTADFGGGCTDTDEVIVTVSGSNPGTLPSCSSVNNNWYFGRNAGITFNNGAPEALTDGQIATDEGTAAMSDADGNLLFYTDGVRVYDRNGDIMANGSNLQGGGSSAQSALIIPKPGSNNRFYVFTSEEAGNFKGLQYSEVDMTLNGGLGDISNVKNVQLVEKITEKMIAVPHSNGSDAWVLVHKWQSNEFLCFLVDASGVSTTPVVSALGDNLSILGKYGTMKANLDGTRIANTIIETGKVQLFDFDAGTGALSNVETLTGVFKPYGVEFSPNGRYLYVGEGGKLAEGSRLFQFDLAAGAITQIQASQVELINLPFSGGALQLGPDGKIYHAIFGAPALGVIENPDMAGLGASYVENGLDLAGNMSRLGLPAASLCIQSCTDIVFDDSGLSITSSDCETDTGSITGLTVTGINGNETYEWIDSDNTIVGTGPDLVDVGEGSYTLTVTEEDCINSIGPFTVEGCESELPDEGPVRVANTMTPNGDGANDMFYIEGIEAYPNNRLVIYNRWGNKVYESVGYDNDWYGTSNSSPLPVAVYYYQLNLGNNEQTTLEGYISILR